MTDDEREQLDARLLAIHKRVEWITSEEARSVWMNGLAARGILDPIRTSLLDETESILDRLSGKN
jgi:hypothetical protein